MSEVCDLLVWDEVIVFLFVFFFKQKTAYEMRISDWSSDVCSSDLQVFGDGHGQAEQRERRHLRGHRHDITHQHIGQRLHHGHQARLLHASASAASVVTATPAKAAKSLNLTASSYR